MKPMRYGLSIFILLAAGISACGHTQATGPALARSTAVDPFSRIVGLYQGPLNHLHAVRRGECPMFPSCSEYARLAIAAHGPVIGWIMAHDRLMRCGRDETATAPRILVNGRWRFFDPVEANDFWWGGPKQGGYSAGTSPRP